MSYKILILLATVGILTFASLSFAGEKIKTIPESAHALCNAYLTAGGDLSVDQSQGVLFSIPSYEVGAANSALKMGYAPGRAWIKTFSNQNSEVHLAQSVLHRPTAVYLPWKLTPGELIEALGLVRALRNLGSSQITIALERPFNHMKIIGENGSLLSPPLAHLFDIAGATTLSYQNIAKPIPTEKTPGKYITPDQVVMMNSSYGPLTDELSGLTGLPTENFNPKQLPEGEHVYLVTSLGENANNHLVELLSQVYALVKAENSVTIVSPYLGYARLEKVDYPGETPVMGKLIVDLIEAMGPQAIIFVHPHAYQSQGFFTKMQTYQLDGRETLLPELIKRRITVMNSPDVSARKDNMKTSAILSDMTGIQIENSMFDKVRDPLTNISSVVGMQDIDFNGKNTATMDDESNTGKSGSEVITIMGQRGAAENILVVVHPTGDMNDAVKNPYVKEIIVTTTVPSSVTDPKVTHVSIAPEIAHQILKIEDERPKK